jgi:hypothetical protein
VTTPTEGEIQICDEGPEPSDGTITLCDKAPEPSDGTIIICADPCGDDLPALTIDGTPTPTVGSDYSATGGRGPYTYSISSASIGPGTGVITSLNGACGSGTVAVSDDCGNLASMTVRFPSGQWVLTSSEAYGPCSTPHCTVWPGCGALSNKTVINGSTKTIYYYKSTEDCSQDYCAINPDYTKVCGGDSFPDGATNSGINCFCLYTVDRYSWECP